MLVLTRKAQEQIQIGNNITISILKVKGNAVRVGIEAPKDVRIVRSELHVFTCEVEIEQHRVTVDRDGPDSESSVTKVSSGSLREFIGNRNRCEVREPLPV